LLRITCDITLTPEGELAVNICGTRITVTSDRIAVLDGEQPTITALTKLDIVVDTTSVEVFANDGEASLTACVQPGHYDLTLTASVADCTVGNLDVVELDSIWPA
jgi:sucrose-6-phosphate hydrolase SacC (GH32 family)